MNALLHPLIALALVSSGSESSVVAEDLTVHEWGTFTSVLDPDNRQIRWNPYVEEDLPSFVTIPKFATKYSTWGNVRMETPVLYFYTDRKMTVDVEVDFPLGKMLEVFPRVKRTKKGIAWNNVTLDPQSNAILPTELQGAHYYAARGAAATPLFVETKDGPEHEKFLFYRGVGDFEVPLEVMVDGDRISVRNRSAHQIDQVMLFERHGDQFAYSIECYCRGEGRVFDRSSLRWSPSLRLDDLKKILRGQGLREDEAQAMVDTWRHDWFEQGTRIFYTVPREETDRLLPLRMNPRPARLERVLIGRVEILSAEMRDEVVKELWTLTNPRTDARAVISALIAKHGRFASAIVQQLREETKDERLIAAIDRWTMTLIEG